MHFKLLRLSSSPSIFPSLLLLLLLSLLLPIAITSEFRNQDQNPILSPQGQEQKQGQGQEIRTSLKSLTNIISMTMASSSFPSSYSSSSSSSSHDQALQGQYQHQSMDSVSPDADADVDANSEANPEVEAQADTNLVNSTLYFGYGSNLWLKQMETRCPTSTYRGVGRLKGYRWMINDRGYANVVEVKKTKGKKEALLNENENRNGNEMVEKKEEEEEEDDDDDEGEKDWEDEVYGLIYTLLPHDEQHLDQNEGVPHSYTKEYIPLSFWPGSLSQNHGWVNTSLPPLSKNQKVPMLVYINRERVTDDVPKREYVYRMNEGIRDALGVGVPRGYVDGVMRRFIPREGSEEEGNETSRMTAERQMRDFRDEVEEED